MSQSCVAVYLNLACTSGQLRLRSFPCSAKIVEMNLELTIFKLCMICISIPNLVYSSGMWFGFMLYCRILELGFSNLSPFDPLLTCCKLTRWLGSFHPCGKQTFSVWFICEICHVEDEFGRVCPLTFSYVCRIKMGSEGEYGI